MEQQEKKMTLGKVRGKRKEDREERRDRYR